MYLYSTYLRGTIGSWRISTSNFRMVRVAVLGAGCIGQWVLR